MVFVLTAAGFVVATFVGSWLSWSRLTFRHRAGFVFAIENVLFLGFGSQLKFDVLRVNLLDLTEKGR